MGNWLPGLTRLFAVVCVFGVFLLGAGGVQEAEVVSFGGGEGYSSFQDIQGLPGFVPGEILVKFRTSLGGELSGQGDLSRLVEQVGIGEVRDRAGRLIRIRGVENVFARFDEQQERWEGLSQADSYGLNESEKRWLGRMGRAPLEVEGVDLGRIYRIEFDLDEGQSIEDALDAYRQCPEVEYAELNTIYSVNVDPNDPLYPLQWPLENVEQDYPASGRYNEPPGTYDKDMDASAAWDIHKGSRAVVIAVVDSGVDYVHRDLAGNMWVNELEEAGAVGVDDDGNGYIDDVYGYDFVNKDGDPLDDNGHGTHCSGIIAAVGNNGQDITGVCPGGRIMALKFLNSSGFGNTADAADAIYYAVNHGADVISNSWGGGGYTATMQAAINYAFSRGVIVVAAAGNDNVDTEQYPANYNHVLSVAATDSNDDKAVFSNYGDWIDLAAPGVDILSLLAEGTPFGTEYDDFTTIASGTSMACPQVAGACGLLFSVNPLLSEEQMFAILMETGDPIGGGICVSDSRVNLFNALSASVPATGRVDLDRDVYSSSSVLNIMLADADLAGGKDPNVWVASSGGDVEEVTLSAAPPGLGIFTGMVTAGVKPVDPNDGVVQVEHGEIITVSYFDVEDEGGSPVWVSDTAIVDNVAPIIISVAVDVPGQEPTLTFETDEPARVQVECGTSLVEPYDVIRHTEQLLTSHVINLVGVAPGTVYYFRIEATDAAGNTSVNDNGGVGFTFTTTGPGDVYVPGDYATIQTAIKSSWDGGMVWIADGIYTGVGNRDIEFLGRAITVQSVNGPENCIIDCEGTRLKPHRGFYFRGEEGADSVLEGVTIRNGYAPGDKGGGIRCDGSSPTINNCVMSDNIAYDENMSNLVDFGGFGGGMYNYHSNPVLTDCKFIGNRSGYEKYIGMINCGGSGGGMYNYFSDAILINCVFIDNVADFEDTVGFGFNGGGGGVFNYRSYPIITGCTFRGNRAETEGGGGGIYCFESGPAITDCMFVGNSAVGGGGGIKYQEFYYHHMRSTVNNCIFSG
ncbi:MAG: S8 family serine peptidase, partial [Planctomycetes bacterium]|nr:S8 family serine peptidase [Planctomycetota bacterium]